MMIPKKRLSSGRKPFYLPISLSGKKIVTGATALASAAPVEASVRLRSLPYRY
jgi:hypothetical protein